MFTLKQNLDEKAKQQIYDHFVTFPIEKEEDIKNFSYQMQLDWKNVQQYEPHFVLSTLLPNIEKWNSSTFMMLSPKRLKQKLKPKHRREQINLVKQIQHIDFTLIKSLELNDQILDTIQPLSNMRLQKLVCLKVQFNYITSLKPLAKIYLPQLSYLAIDHNKKIDEEYKYFTRMHFGKKDCLLRAIPQGHGIPASIKYHLFKLDQNSAFVDLINWTHRQIDRVYSKVMIRKFKSK